MNIEEMNYTLKDSISSYNNINKNIINDEFILQVFQIEDNELKDDEYILQIKKIKILENKIKSYYNIKDDLIFAKIELIDKNSIINHFEFKVYDKKGNELNLHFLKEEVIYSYQINELELMDFEKGYFYNKKGINIYNSKCFNSFCCLIPYKGKMLNLKERRNIIFKNITFCEDNCYFKSNNYKNKKIECSCIINQSLEDYLKIKEFNDNRTNFNLEIDDNINTHKKVLKCINLFNKWNIKSNISFWVCLVLILTQISSLIIFIVDIRKIFAIIYRKINFNPPKSEKKNFEEKNNNGKNNNDIHIYNNNENNNGSRSQDNNIYNNKKYFEEGISKLNLNDKSDYILNDDMMNQKFKKFSKIKNDNNSSIMTGVHDFPNRNNNIDNQLVKTNIT